MDRLSQAPLWQFSTGPPLSKHITTTNSDLSYLIYPLDESDLVEVHNGTGVVCFAQTLVLQIFLFQTKSCFSSWFIPVETSLGTGRVHC